MPKKTRLEEKPDQEYTSQSVTYRPGKPTPTVNFPVMNCDPSKAGEHCKKMGCDPTYCILHHSHYNYNPNQKNNK